MNAIDSFVDDAFGLHLLTSEGPYLTVPDDETPRSAMLCAAAEDAGLAWVVVAHEGKEHRAVPAYEIGQAAFELSEKGGPHQAVALATVAHFGLIGAARQYDVPNYLEAMSKRWAAASPAVQAEAWRIFQATLGNYS